MNKITSLLFLVIFVLNFSCKENTSHTQIENKKPHADEPSLSVEFVYKTNKTDVFKIMMNNIKVDELQTKHIHITENVIPTTSNDVIEANFDPNNLSKQIVLHLGNKTEKSVTINRILISYGDIFFDLNSVQDFNKHLVFNKFIIRDSTSNKLSTKRIDGKLNPTIRIKNSLINQLQR
ncbi:MAG: hypothetical protein P8H40_05805 [Winogradskyella sp.]|nr:hypothetical protein [Winogradskyella sp.]